MNHEKVVIHESFTIKIGGKTVKANFTLTFSITDASSAITADKTSFSGQVGVQFDDNIGLKGGNGGPITITGVDDPANIPPGLNIDPSGAISGVPTKAGTYTLGVNVQDSDG